MVSGMVASNRKGPPPGPHEARFVGWPETASPGPGRKEELLGGERPHVGGIVRDLLLRLEDGLFGLAVRRRTDDTARRAQRLRPPVAAFQQRLRLLGHLALL